MILQLSIPYTDPIPSNSLPHALLQATAEDGSLFWSLVHSVH